MLSAVETSRYIYELLLHILLILKANNIIYIT